MYVLLTIVCACIVLVQSSTMSSTTDAGKKRQRTDNPDDSAEAKFTYSELLDMYNKLREDAEEFKKKWIINASDRGRFKRELETATAQGIKWQQQAYQYKGQNALLQEQLAALKKELDEVSTKLHFFQFMQMLDEQQENDADDADDEGGSDGESDPEVDVEDEVNDDDVNDGNETDS